MNTAWTIGALKTYFDELRKADKEAVENARVSMEKRLDGMNEFRDTLKDQAGTFVTKEQLNQAIKTIIGFVIAIASIAVAILSLLKK
jgi:hypothetical protein